MSLLSGANGAANPKTYVQAWLAVTRGCWGPLARSPSQSHFLEAVGDAYDFDATLVRAAVRYLLSASYSGVRAHGMVRRGTRGPGVGLGSLPAGHCVGSDVGAGFGDGRPTPSVSA